MSAFLRRSVPAALSVLLLVGLAACGSDDKPATATGSSADRLDAVTITGEVGSAPQVAWKSRMSASKIEQSTIIAGEGPAVAEGQTVLAQLWIGNGYTKQMAFSSYDEGAAQLISSSADSNTLFSDALKGATIGSRIAVTASAETAFGESGNPALGIGNKDSVLVIMDLLSPLADAPSGTRAAAPDWMPPIAFTDGKPSAFDFTGIPAPVGKFRKATLLTGDGERVRKGMTVAVNYLGEVYGGDKPFDQNYTGQVTTFAIGVGKVIPGWDKQVVGSTVGSRIVIEVPPALGYGTAGNTGAGIKGTDTLYFVIDILAAG